MTKVKFSNSPSASANSLDSSTVIAGLQDVPYSVRESARAKNVSIKVSRSGRIELVIPKGFSHRRLSEIVRDRQDWIAKTLNRLEAERQSLPQDLVSDRPDRIVLGALPETWEIAYTAASRDRLRYRVTGENRLTIEGDISSVDLCQEALRHWLAHKAKAHLPQWLRQVSHNVGLACNDISIRKQRTLWASCSSKKNISLNYKLLFLPPHLVRYIFVHELCHTVHMNHSSRFWNLVGEIDSHYEWKDQELRDAWKYVPQWVEEAS